MQLARPTHLSERAQRTLQRLAAVGLGKAISVGGALGIQHYLDYRPTHDVDAWWTAAAGPTERAEVVRLVEEALAEEGDVRTRRWGEVRSWVEKELLDALVD